MARCITSPTQDLRATHRLNCAQGSRLTYKLNDEAGVGDGVSRLHTPASALSQKQLHSGGRQLMEWSTAKHAPLLVRRVKALLSHNALHRNDNNTHMMEGPCCTTCYTCGTANHARIAQQQTGFAYTCSTEMCMHNQPFSQNNMKVPLGYHGPKIPKLEMQRWGWGEQLTCSCSCSQRDRFWSRNR